MNESEKIRIVVELAKLKEISQHDWSLWETGLSPSEMADLEEVGVEAVKAASEYLIAIRLVDHIGVVSENGK